MSNFQSKKAPVVFTATNRRILAMSTPEHRAEVFQSINSNKVSIDRSEFRTPKLTMKGRKAEFKKKTPAGYKPKVLFTNAI